MRLQDKICIVTGAAGGIGATSANHRKSPRSPSFWPATESRFVTASTYNVDGGWAAGMNKALALI